VDVRSFQPTDTAAIVTLFRDTIHRINSRDYTPEQVNAWAPAEMDLGRWAARLRASFTVVAEEDGDLLGFANLEANGHVDCLYTHAAHQGRGVATALLQALERKAKELGLARLFTEASITARPFFAARGFVVLARQEVECRGARFVNFRMEKYLTAAPPASEGFRS
jgi:GNAT superfamily N-acetyltransferase